MKIVIDIPEYEYKNIKEYYEKNDIVESTYSYIYHGTPLPKGHGRLIDADELYDDFIDGTEGYDCQTWNRIEIGDIIEDAPTIIGGSESE
jgi:hypothetical protein